MKIVVLLSVLVLNLAFGVYYKNLVKQCGNGNSQSCNRLVNMCNKDDGEACFALGMLGFLLSANAGDEREADDFFNVSKVIFQDCCNRFKHQDCCRITKDLNKIQ